MCASDAEVPRTVKCDKLFTFEHTALHTKSGPKLDVENGQKGFLVVLPYLQLFEKSLFICKSCFY